MTKANIKALAMAFALVAFVLTLRWVAGAP